MATKTKTAAKKAGKAAAGKAAKKAAAGKKPTASKPAPKKSAVAKKPAVAKQSAAAKKPPAKKPAAARPSTAKSKPAPARKIGSPPPAAGATREAATGRSAARGRSAAVAAALPPVPAVPPPPQPIAPKPQSVASPQDVAAAHEYLLTRSATRSTEPVYVNGRLLPSEDHLLKMSEADYMNADQLAFFKHRLQQMERELLANADETTEHLRETVIVPDPADRATIEEEHALELRTRDRERKLLKKVQQALGRIDSGEYGFCEETGDPIGIPRLLARPTATLSLEAQQRRELKQKLFGD